MQNNVNIQKMHKDKVRNMFQISRSGQKCSISMLDAMITCTRPCITMKKVMPTDYRIGYNLIHYHDYLELLYVAPNSDKFTHIIEDKLFIAETDNLILIPTSVKHRIQDTTSSSIGYLLNFMPEYAKSAADDKYKNLFLDWGNLLPWISNGNLNRLTLKIPAENREELYSIVLKVSELCFNLLDVQYKMTSELIPKYSSELEISFRKFISILGSAFYSSCSTVELEAFEKFRPPILAALNYIDEHLCEQIKLSDIYACAGLKSAWFSKIFHGITGFTVIEYINFIRARKAREMLVNTNMPMSEISEACGFSSAIYFDRVFKSQTGCSPRLYRDEYAIEWQSDSPNI